MIIPHDRNREPLPPLPNRAKQFPANLVSARLAITHHPLAGAKDGNAKAVQDGTKLIVAAIKPAARAARPVNFPNDLLPPHTNLVKNPQAHLSSLSISFN